MNTDTNQDYTNLKYALCHLSERDTYEKIRARLIAERGYDGFRTLQNRVFKEIGTIAFEETLAPRNYKSQLWKEFGEA